MVRTADIQKLKHQFLPSDAVITHWESLEPYFKTLLATELNSVEVLEKWLRNLSELEAFISEDACWKIGRAHV